MAQRTDCFEGKWAELMAKTDEEIKEKLSWWESLSPHGGLPTLEELGFKSSEERKLDEIHKDLKEIKQIVSAYKDNGYFLMNKVWRKLGTG
jgi:hypothetical protein